MRKLGLLLAVFLGCITNVYSQGDAVRVLFIGNSYTSVNNLPNMVCMVSISAGKPYFYSIDYDNTPGGATFAQHCTNHSMTLIQQGGWDYVVLQEQSQLPSFPINQVEVECFPYAERLVDSVYANNPCAIPMFYMTWGRENGDQQNAQYYPPLGTYEGMDSLLYERYMMMKEANDAAVSPVGRVWRYIRTNYPHIDLYDSDGSHPSLAGTYAAACTFFTVIHQSDPMAITHNPGISDEDRQHILEAVRAVAYDSLERWLRPMPKADFSATVNRNDVAFENLSENATSYIWYFGDGYTSTEENPQHTYTTAGNYYATMVANRHCEYDTIQKVVAIDSVVSITDVSVEDNLEVYPNPAKNVVYVSNASETITSVVLTDVSGRVMFSKEVSEHSLAIDLQDMPKGMYVLTICIGNNAPVYRKVIVE